MKVFSYLCWISSFARSCFSIYSSLNTCVALLRSWRHSSGGGAASLSADLNKQETSFCNPTLPCSLQRLSLKAFMVRAPRPQIQKWGAKTKSLCSNTVFLMRKSQDVLKQHSKPNETRPEQPNLALRLASRWAETRTNSFHGCIQRNKSAAETACL